MEAPRLEELDPEDIKVINIIQDEARKQNKVFFFEDGDGPELEIDGLYLL